MQVGPLIWVVIIPLGLLKVILQLKRNINVVVFLSRQKLRALPSPFQFASVEQKPSSTKYIVLTLHVSTPIH